jgi:hypothetical protein
MIVKVGDTVKINGDEKTIKSLTRGGIITTTDDETFDAWFDIVEAA